MLKNITIFSFKKIPAGFSIFIALVLITEGFVYLSRPGLINDYWNKFIINENELIKMPGNYDYLIIGDSIQKTGINPTLVSDKILSLGLPGAKPMGLFLLLKRYLKNHKSPKAIFLYINTEDAHDSLYVILRYFINIPEFISVWKDLTWEERQCFIVRYWASLDLRKVELTIRDKYPYHNSVFIETLKKNNGYMPSPRDNLAIANDYFSRSGNRYQKKISFSETDMRYLDKFIQLASSYNIKIIFLGILLPKEIHDIFEKAGFNNDFLSFINKLKARYPSTYFVKEPMLYLENNYFGDASHVNKKGSEIYTEYFKKQIFIPYSTLREKTST